MSINRDLYASARRLLDELDMAPMSARSILLSYLLGTHPPEVPAARLVVFGELFGLRAGTVRTALSRMAADGELVADDGRYRLAGRLLDRQRELDRGQRTTTGAWNGDWWTVLVTAEARSIGERRRFRRTMEGALLGELRPDTWMRPANLTDCAPPLGSADMTSIDRSGAIITRGPLITGDATALASQLWDLVAIETMSAAILDVIAPLGDAVVEAGADDDHETLAALLPLTFEVSAGAVRHLRTEPQLPMELTDCPAGAALRASYAEVNVAFLDTLDQHLRHRAPSPAQRQ